MMNSRFFARLAGCMLVASLTVAATANQAATPPAQPPAQPATNPASPAAAPTQEAQPGAPVSPAPRKAREGVVDRSPSSVPAQAPQGAQVATQRPPVSAAQALKIEPSPLDLGEMSPEVAKSGKVKITNTTDHPVKIIKVQPACGCTTTSVPPDALAPGASTEMDITIKPPAQGGHPLSKNVTFMVQDHAPTVLTVQGLVKEYLSVVPNVIQGPSTENPAPAPVRITVKDGGPVRITGATPDIFVSLPTEAATTHDLQIDWAKWEKAGGQSKVAVLTDHPKAPQASFLIKKPVRLDANSKSAQAAKDTARGTVSPLIVASREGNLAKVSEALKGGAAVEGAEPTTGRTALHFAAENGNMEVIKVLLEAKANPNAADRTGRSPVAIAAEKSRSDALKALIAAGGSVELKDQLGGTPISMAAALGNADTVRILLEAGAQANVVDRQGMTPLIWAASIGKHETVQLLIDRGADIEVRDQIAGETALTRAIRTGEIESVKALLAKGAKLDVRNNQGMTPLLVACASGDLAKIKLLVDAGADKGAKDSRGWGMIDFARNRIDASKPDVVKYLEPIAPPSTAVAPPEGTPSASATKGQ